MTEMIDWGNEVELYGKSGASYKGRIYTDQNSATDLSGRTIVCLTNSRIKDGVWEHQIEDIYGSNDPQDALTHFKGREDRTHLILIPETSGESANVDKVYDLIQNYIHK
jgi:hypothetical protein